MVTERSGKTGSEWRSSGSQAGDTWEGERRRRSRRKWAAGQKKNCGAGRRGRRCPRRTLSHTHTHARTAHARAAPWPAAGLAEVGGGARGAAAAAADGTGGRRLAALGRRRRHRRPNLGQRVPACAVCLAGDGVAPAATPARRGAPAAVRRHRPVRPALQVSPPAPRGAPAAGRASRPGRVGGNTLRPT